MDIIEISKNYCLHDCYINKIKEDNSKLIFFIDGGIYKLGKNLKCGERTTKCKYIIRLDDLKKNEEYEHISAVIFKKNKRKELNFDELVSLVEKNKFSVYMDFYTNFAKCILLKGFLGANEAEIEITEINDIQIIFHHKNERGF